MIICVWFCSIGHTGPFSISFFTSMSLMLNAVCLLCRTFIDSLQLKNDSIHMIMNIKSQFKERNEFRSSLTFSFVIALNWILKYSLIEISFCSVSLITALTVSVFDWKSKPQERHWCPFLFFLRENSCTARLHTQRSQFISKM